MPARRDDGGLGGRRLLADAAVLLHQIGHGEVDAGEVLAGQLRIPRVLGAGRQQHGVKVAHEVVERQGDADIDAVVEGDALGLHLGDAPVDVALLHLEVGDAVAQQATGARLALIDVDVVADAGELLGCGEAGRAGADHGDALAGGAGGRLGHDPAHLPGLVGNRLLDGLDGDRHVLEVEGAGLLARRGADPAGELGEVVGGVEVARRLLPVARVDEVVPVRDLVVDRAAGARVAIGDAAVHAARRLPADILLVQRQRELAEMADPVAGELVLLLLAVELEETRDLAHLCPA